MANIFSGLENLGLKNIEKVDIFQKKSDKKKEQQVAEKK